MGLGRRGERLERGILVLGREFRRRGRPLGRGRLQRELVNLRIGSPSWITKEPILNSLVDVDFLFEAGCKMVRFLVQLKIHLQAKPKVGGKC